MQIQNIKGLKKAASLVFAISLVMGMTSVPVNASNNGITLSGTCHVQDYGDTNGVWDETTGTLTLGTRGQAKRVEAITINMTNETGYGGSLKYRVHVQDIGWQEYRYAGEMAGTSGQAKRLEGIEMELEGDLAAYYTVEYAVHIQDYGDAQGFVADGTLAGTTGESKRLEEVQVRIVPRGTGTSMSVNYRVHRQDYGWESSWAKDGAESGTTGQAKRLEGIEIHLTGNQYAGSIEYHTHVQNIGWESVWSKDGEMSGTQGLSYRLEGIEIKLTGDIANYYDVYYRVHAQDYGWLGWAKNGEMSGTSGMSKRLEAIQIVLVAKGGAAPGNMAGITSVMSEPAVINGTPTSPSGSQPSSGSQSQSSTSGSTSSSSSSGNKPAIIYPQYEGAPEMNPNAVPLGMLWGYSGVVDSLNAAEQTPISKNFMFPLDMTEDEMQEKIFDWFFLHAFLPTGYGNGPILYSDGTIRDPDNGRLVGWVTEDGKYTCTTGGVKELIIWDDEDAYFDENGNLQHKTPPQDRVDYYNKIHSD